MKPQTWCAIIENIILWDCEYKYEITRGRGQGDTHSRAEKKI